MNNKIQKTISHIAAIFFIVSIFILPVIVFAQTPPAEPTLSAGGFIVCDGGKTDPCTFAKIMTFLRFALNFAVYKIITPIFIVMLMWQGFMLITNAVNPKPVKLTAIKSHIMTILTGYLFVLAAWLIVKTIIVILAGETPSFEVFFN